MRAKLRKARKMTSSLSKREKMRRKPLSLRKSLSISLRLRYMARSYSHGSRRLWGGVSRESNQNRAPVAGFCYLHRRRPSRDRAVPGVAPDRQATPGPVWRRRLDPARARRLLPFEHLRQPDESWWSIRRVTCRWIVGRFFKSAHAVGMDLNAGRIHRNGLDFDAHQLLPL